MHKKFGLEIIKKYRLECLGTDGQNMLKYVSEIRHETVNRILFLQDGNNWGKGVRGALVLSSLNLVAV